MLRPRLRSAEVAVCVALFLTALCVAILPLPGAAQITPAATTITTPASGGPALWSGGYPIPLTAAVVPATISEGTVTFSVADSTGTAIGKAVTSAVIRSGAASATWVLPSGTVVGTYTITATYSGTANFATSTATSTMTLKDYSVLFPQPAAPGIPNYDIVFCRCPRDATGLTPSAWGEVYNSNAGVQPGTDLCVRHPDGTIQTLVSSANGTATADAIGDPYVDFDGNSVLYTRYRFAFVGGAPVLQGSDILRLNLTRDKTTGLITDWSTITITHGGYAPNRAADDLNHFLVLNSCPCPLPGGRICYCSNIDGIRPNKPYSVYNLKLYTMDGDGRNIQCITPMELGCALHPTIHPDGQIWYSTMQNQGLRANRQWAAWRIDPDGTSWAPGFFQASGPFAWHFFTPLTDGRMVLETYYNSNNKGFGSLYTQPEPTAIPTFTGATLTPPAGQTLPPGSQNNAGVSTFRFAPIGYQWLTPMTTGEDRTAPLSVPTDPFSPNVGKFIHPCGTRNNGLLVAWTPGPAARNQQPQDDAGIYLFDASPGKFLNAPTGMVKILNDPNFQEFWPRPVLPFSAIYGKPAPDTAPELKNNGTVTPGLPEGTPYFYLGTSSLYKREAMLNGTRKAGSVTDTNPRPSDAWGGADGLYHSADSDIGDNNWTFQGSEGKVNNDDIVAIRILAMEQTTQLPGNIAQSWGNYANERMGILCEVPVRKFANGVQPKDPDGNSDTSFLIKLPANRPVTLQAIHKSGMAIHLAQTWHQGRPGEIRDNCGGCHAHSQVETSFDLCAAAKATYTVWDATDTAPKGRPMLCDKASDQSGQQWDVDNKVGVKYVKSGEIRPEFNHDILPILKAKCVSCHGGATPAGKLKMDMTSTNSFSLVGQQGFPRLNNIPDTYSVLAAQTQVGAPLAPFGNQLLPGGGTPLSRFTWSFRAINSLLYWKVWGARTDSWQNSDFPTETSPGDLTTVPPTFKLWNGQTVTMPAVNMKAYCDIDYIDGGCQAAVVTTDAEKRLFGQWIDCGLLVDLSGGAVSGGLQDDQPPTLTLPYPIRGANAVPLTRLVVGACDTGSGLDINTISIKGDFNLDGKAAGTELASLLTPSGDGRWSYTLQTPIATLPAGNLTVKVQDKAGNRSQIVRSFSIAAGGKQVATTTTVASATAVSASADQPVTLTATVAPATVSEGTVTFTVNGTTQVGSTVTSPAVQAGAASAVWSLPAGTVAGTYTIQAVYNGTANFSVSQGSGILTVAAPVPAATITTVAPVTAAMSALVAQPLTLTAAVAPATVSEGTVTFSVTSGTVALGVPSTSGTVSGGSASATWALPLGAAAGSYTITAVYGGTAHFATSQGTATLTVTLASNPNQPTIDQLQGVISNLQAQIAVLQDSINTLQTPAASIRAKKKGMQGVPQLIPYRTPKGSPLPFPAPLKKEK